MEAAVRLAETRLAEARYAASRARFMDLRKRMREAWVEATRHEFGTSEAMWSWGRVARLASECRKMAAYEFTKRGKP